MLKTLLFIGMGSFTGGVLRYLISRYVQNFLTPSSPWEHCWSIYSVVSPSACFTDSSNGEI